MPRIFTDIDDTILKDGQPVEKVVRFIDETAEEVVVLTNRPESDREKTVADLEAIGFEYDGLIMNDSGEEAPAFKSKVIKAELDAGRPVDLFIDNRPDTREAVAALGVEVMAPEDVPEVVEEEEEVEDEVEEEVAPAASVANSSRINMTIEEQLVKAAASLAGLTAERDDLRATVEKLTVGASSEAAKMQGIKMVVIKSGKFKGAGIEGTSLDEDQMGNLQASVDTIHAEFKEAVNMKRKMVKAEAMEGQTFSGKQAAVQGLVTGLADSFNDALRSF